MSDLDKAVARFTMRWNVEKDDYQARQKRYKGDRVSRSGLSTSDFNNLKSKGKYAWK